MPIVPTAEQSAIIRAVRESSASLMVTAYAGTAKTTTIEMAAKELPEGNSTLALAFNVKIKEELEKRLPKFITVKTMNGLGHGAWLKACGRKASVEPQKLGKIITELAKSNKLELSKEAWVDAKNAVVAARNAGIVPSQFPFKGLLPDDPTVWKDLFDEHDLDFSHQAYSFARECLITSCKQAFQGVIDFDDQIYMSVCFGGVFPQFHTILVDEAQDLSIMNHRMVGKCKPQRLIICGDPKQSLYGFRGAASDSMGKMRGLAQEWTTLPLTTTFRCPKSIVARQQEHAPGYRAAEHNAEGQVVDLSGKPWTLSTLPISGTTAILCRNNGPLVKMAFKLLRQGVAVSMLGRDLGTGLVKTVQKLGLGDHTGIVDVISALRAWYNSESQKLLAAEKTSQQEKLSDRYESILAIAEDSKITTQGNLLEAIKTLFSKENGRVVFGTAHRAKGLEWDVVLHLDPWRIPSKFAKSEEELEQEANCRYVVETRAKHTLLLADAEDFS